MPFFSIGVCRVGEQCKVGDELVFGSYTSIIATESIVTIWMNLRKAFSGKSFTMRIPSKAPMPITGSIRRFSENEPQVMLSQAKIYLFSLPNISLHIITAIARASVHPISRRNPWAGMSLSTKSATRNPRIAVGNSFATVFQSAMRL